MKPYRKNRFETFILIMLVLAMLTVHGSPFKKRTVAPQPISLLSAMCKIVGYRQSPALLDRVLRVLANAARAPTSGENAISDKR